MTISAKEEGEGEGEGEGGYYPRIDAVTERRKEISERASHLCILLPALSWSH